MTHTSGQTGPLIFLADDEPHITHMVERKLTQLGYRVLSAPDGQQALDQIRENLPDLVVTDLQMPYMSGIELTTRLNESDKTNHIPVIMLTARGFAVEDQANALPNLRVMLSKPFSTRQLAETIALLLEETRGAESAA